MSMPTFTRSLMLLVVTTATLAACAGPTATPINSSASDEAQLMASRWELVKWPDHVIPNGDNGEPVMLNFANETGQGHVSGRSWCNNFSATYALASANRLTIGQAVGTRKMCPEPAMQFESDFLNQLQTVNTYSFSGPLLEISTSDHQTLTFHRREKPSAAAKTKLVYVASEKAPCSNGVMRTTCYQIREDKTQPWQLWYGDIVGFKPEPGIAYRLRILEEKIPNPPQDASSIKWTLDMVIEQEVIKSRN
ncbi:META and DUF4377 domain-containing protein [Glaciimonas soli]|uniref:DUF4377 domain-containing protein n=1 Tax=Glaciimonas soli TaxID=2590999 RepID=A0A843YWC9_9BURK|nr:META and DUF4377 domain-containing protein [Glaciimonas soli]MQR00886.1 DUF4377 domain-containing protein [Glaciimonas soli]